MSSPKVIIQIMTTYATILGRAFVAAGRQAAKNARTGGQQTIGADAAGVNKATTGSPTDVLTRAHRMTIDEAHLILNLKRGEELEAVAKRYEHLFRANSPPAVQPGAKPTAHSHYIQSKVVRARERIEAELAAEGKAPPPGGSAPPPPGGSAPPPPGGSAPPPPGGSAPPPP